jgi:Mrp family chromosome partitioning ATPase
MSSTDQAFIRAYGQAVRSPRTPARPERAPAASADMIDGILAQSASAWLETASADAGPNPPVWMVHSSSIDVGLNSTVPAPHFAHRKNSSAISESAAAAMNGLDAVESRIGKGNRPVASQLAFGQSPKAPLSSFASSNIDSTVPSAPKPAFEIDAVRWPAICHTLLTECGSQFAHLADNLRQEAAEGRKVLAVTGLGRGEGRTTLALTLAKQLAESRIRVAVVDADFAAPSVASRLSIGAECGWETSLCGEQSVWDVMIEATTNRLSIVPLSAAHFADEMPRPVYGIAAVLAELAENFDLVLIDAGPLSNGNATDWLFDPAAGVQGVILAHDARRNDASRLAAVCLQLAEAGVRQLGIAEMFSECRTQPL